MDKEAETKQEVANHYTRQKMNKEQEPEPDQPQPQEKQTNSDPSSPSPLALPSPSPSPPIPTNQSSSPPSPPPDSSSVSSLSSHGTSASHELKHSSTTPENPPSSKQSPSPVALAYQTYRTEPAVVTKVDAGAQDDFADAKEVEDGIVNSRGGSGAGVGVDAGSNRRLRPNLSILRRAKRERTMKRSLLGFRLCGFAFCLISFSVMAADKDQGWAIDSFYRYKEFRYCMAVNVIGFAYSGLQVYDLVNYFTTGKHIFRHHLRSYIDFSIDQMLTYLLISASSSAATRVYDWLSNWGQDKFPEMASASVGLSFIAFVAFALSSLISGYTLCKSS